MQIINFIKTQSAFVGLLPSHTWRCARRGGREESRTLGDANVGENVRRVRWMKEGAACVCVRDKQMDGWTDGRRDGGQGFDVVRITTSPSDGQPTLDLELYGS